MTTGSARDEAEAAMRLADIDPMHAAPVALTALRRARREGDLAAESIALRALGYSLMMCGDMDTAIRRLRRAIEQGERAGAPELVAKARVILAFAVNQRGRPQLALKELDAALGDLDDHSRTKVLAQRAVIRWQLGRLDEALADYHAALPVLRRVGDSLSVQRTLVNRGILHAERYDFQSAIADLEEAAQLCRRHGRELSLGIVESNLGWVMTLRGDVPTALGFFGSAERRIHAQGGLLGPLFQDRCGLLLSVGLLAEARVAADAAVEAYRRERRQLRVPEARLQLAQVALLSGDPGSGERHARTAVKEFRRQQRHEWAALAQVVLIRGQLSAGRPCRTRETQLDGMAATLNQANWPAAVVECRLAAAALAARRGNRDGARAHLKLATAAAPRPAPATLRARVLYAKALLQDDLGDRRGAIRATRRALQVLDDHSAAMGATDLRAHVALYRRELADLGLRSALKAGRHASIFEWAERGKASHLLQRPIRPPADPVGAQLLSELRLVSRQVQEQSTAALARRQRQLERQVRDHSRQHRGLPGGPPTPPVTAAALTAALGHWALLEFIQVDDLLYGLSLVDSRMRLNPIGRVHDVARLVQQIPFALHRLARRRAGQTSTAAALELLKGTAADLDAVLLQPFASRITDRPLVIVPTGPLHGLPWSTLPLCAGRPLTVSASATLWHAARTRVRAGTGGVAVAAGPQLNGAREEAVAIASLYGVTALVDEAATTAATLAALRTAELVHLAAHGRLAIDNPLFSSLLMADGPLMVYDLEHLPQMPRTVVLAACDAAQSAVRAGDELLGLSAAFMTRGTAQILASVVTIPDAQTVRLMLEVHRLLAGGAAPAAALSTAQQHVTAVDDPSAIAAAAGFICLGAGS